MNSPLTSTFKGPRVVITSSVSTTPFTLDDTSSEALSVNATSSGITINLPLISAVLGRSFTVRKIDGTANVVTITAAGSDLIEGSASMTLTTAWQSVTLDNDGVQWHRVGTNSAAQSSIVGTVQGEVLFVNSSLIPVGDTLFKWDTTNKRLGLGTTTPANILDARATDVGAGTTVSVTNLSSTGFATVDVNADTGALSMQAYGSSASPDANLGRVKSSALLTGGLQLISGSNTTGIRLYTSNGSSVDTLAATIAAVTKAATFVGAISASNLSGTNTGDITLAAVGSTPNANAASLSGQALTLQPASSTLPGILTAGTQTIGGSKSFNADLNVLGTLHVTSNAAGHFNMGPATLGDTSHEFTIDTNTTIATIRRMHIGMQVSGGVVVSNDFGNGAFIWSGTINASGPATAFDLHIGAHPHDGTTGIDTTKVMNFSATAPYNIGVGIAAPGSRFAVAGTIESTTGGFKFPDASLQTTALTSGTQTFAGEKSFSSVLGLAKIITGSLPTAVGREGFIVYDDTTNTVKFSDGASWTNIAAAGGSGVSSLAAVDSSPNANGATIVGTTLNLEPASASFPGVVTTGVQSFAGAKTFTGAITASNYSGTSSGTNSGDITLAAVDSSPNANGASLSGQVLTLQPASASFPGLITTGVQSFAGAKTFTGAISASNLSGTNTGDVTLAAIGAVPNANAASLSGQALTLQPASASFGGVVTTGTQVFAGDKSFTTILGLAKIITSSLPAAAAGNEGYIVYDDTTNTVKFSDGSTWANISTGGGSGVTTMAAIGAVPNANGASIASTTLTLQPADVTFGGVVTTGTQSFAGAKTFTGDMALTSASTAPLSITGTSNNAMRISITNSSNGANALGGLLVNSDTANSNIQVLATSSGLTPAGTLGPLMGYIATGSGATGGLVLNSSNIILSTSGVARLTVTATTGTFAGTVSASNLSGTNTGDITLGTVGSTPAAAGASLSGQVLTLQPANASNGGVVSTTTQTFAGAKTFTGAMALTLASGNSLVVDTSTLVVDATNHRIGFGDTSPAAFAHFKTSLTGASLVRVQNTHASGFSELDFYDDGGTFKGGIGYGNSGVGAPFTSQMFFHAASGQSLAFTIATTGKVGQFSNNGDFFVDTNVLYVDAVNNKIGVNKSNPSSTLDVTGSIAASTTIAATGNVTGANLSGTNTGDITLGTVGSTPAAAGASLSGQVLTLQPANASNGGVVSTTTQTFAGAKTFTGATTLSGVVADTDTFSVDATNHRVGFGTATPTYKVHGAFSVPGSDAQYIFENVSTSSQSASVMYVLAKNATASNFTTNSQLHITSGDASAQGDGVVGSSTLYFETNNSTLSPTAQFFKFAHRAPQAALMLFSDSIGSGNTIGGVMTWLRTGNIGIGTPTPSERLNVVGNILATGTILGSNLSGTNTGNQTITLTGDVTGSGTGSFAATIATTIPNAHTFSGAITFSTPNVYKGTVGITAFATGGQASATALTAQVNFVDTVATTGDSVKLPVVSLGANIMVFNDGANAVDIFPVTGSAIDALGTNAAFSLAAGQSRAFWGKSSTLWKSR